jgi:hypothetical protein
MILILTGVPANHTTGFNASGFNTYQVDWGDGIINTNTATHTYTNSGTYTVKLYSETSGSFITYLGMTNKTYLTGITTWGDLGPNLRRLSSIGGLATTVMTTLPNYLPSQVNDIQSILASANLGSTVDISNWNTTNIGGGGMYNAFGACTFNGQDISRWNVSNVTSFESLFFYSNFNGDITQWNINPLAGFRYMFQGASTFNQNMGSWPATFMNDIIYSYGFDTLNNTMTLIGWAAQTGLPSNQTSLFGGYFYESGQSAYNYLTTTLGWSFPNLIMPALTTPVLAVQYNQNTTRVYSIGNAILSYTPSLTGTYDHVVFSSVPALSTIGLNLNTATGVISGTPIIVSNPTVYTVTCNAYNSGNTLIDSSSCILTFSVKGGVYYSPSSYSFFLNVALSPITPISNGVSINSYSISPALPTGLTIDPTYGIISGTPTAINNVTTYTITAITLSGITYNPTVSLTVADISYASSSYVFLADVLINVISPTVLSYLNNATFSFTPSLPSGLNIDQIIGDISGTPHYASLTQNPSYTLTVSTFSNYSKTFSFPMNVVDISYVYGPYTFLENIPVNIQPLPTYTNLYDASLNLPLSLPAGILMDQTGNISGKPTTAQETNTYTLNIVTKTTPNYNKNVTLQMGVADISYTYLAYEFLSDILINRITPTPSLTNLTNTALQFNRPLPSGLNYGIYGDISGTPFQISQPSVYDLTISTTNNPSPIPNYSKTIPFTFGVADISYTYLDYEFLSDISINNITPSIIDLSNATLQFNRPLPSGLNYGIYGDISGTPFQINQPSVYGLIISTTNTSPIPNYSKTIPFTFGVADISYTYLAYEFLSDISLNIRPSIVDLSNATLQLNRALPSGIDYGIYGDISGTPAEVSLMSSYNITITTTNPSPISNYSKSIDLSMAVVDISYTTIDYEFLAAIAINPITPTNYTSLQDATLNFINGLPQGVIMDGSGNISGTPTQATERTTYPLKISTSNKYTPIYSKIIPFTLAVADINYLTLSYAFLANVSVNIQPIASQTNIVDVSLIFSLPLPDGISMDTSGNFSGTPITPIAPYVNFLTISTTNPANYSKTLTFNFDVADISYNTVSYDFFTGTQINNISSNDPDSLNNATLSFPGPRGLSIDRYGTISGTTIDSFSKTTYYLTISTANGYNKSIPFYLASANIIYPNSLYNFLSDLAISPPIVPQDFIGLNTATFTFTPPLPPGVQFNNSNGIISGTPISYSPQTTYTLEVKTSNDYFSYIPFYFSVSDISYDTLSYGFLKDISVDIEPTILNALYNDAFINITAFTSGLIFQQNGRIIGIPSVISDIQSYVLTLSTSRYVNPVYTKTMTFNITVSDISYNNLIYGFLADLPINQIQPTVYNKLYNATLSQAFPPGLTMDSSGNITGKPSFTSAPNIYNLILTSSSNYIKILPFRITVSDISYAELNYLFLSDVDIHQIKPTIYNVLYDASLTSNQILPSGLQIDAFGTIYGTPNTITLQSLYELTLTSTSNYEKKFIFDFTVTDISYASFPYIYLQNKEFLYSPFLGLNISPTIYQPDFIQTISMQALPSNLHFDYSNGIISGTPNISAGNQNYILTVTILSGYQKNIILNIEIKGFNYIINVAEPIYTFKQYESISIPIAQNIGGLTNFIISPDLPKGVNIESTTGKIEGIIIAPQINNINLFSVTGYINSILVTVPIIINVIGRYPESCIYVCPPTIIIPKEISTINSRAMRYSTLMRTGLGQTRYIENSNTNINKTYQEPARNKF